MDWFKDFFFVLKDLVLELFATCGGLCQALPTTDNHLLVYEKRNFIFVECTFLTKLNLSPVCVFYLFIFFFSWLSREQN